MTIGLFEGFKTGIFPIIAEGSKVLFVISIISGATVIMRNTSNSAEGIKKIKLATLGYTIIKIVFLYVEFIDKIIASIKF